MRSGHLPTPPGSEGRTASCGVVPPDRSAWRPPTLDRDVRQTDGVTAKISVAGLGYVGLSMAVLLARHNTVVGLDLDVARIETAAPRREPDPRRRHLALPRRGGARPHLHHRRRGGPHRRGLRDHRDADQLRPGDELLRHRLDRGGDARRHPHRPRRDDGREVHRPGGLHRGRTRAAGHRQRHLLPRVPPRGPGAARQPPPRPHRRGRGLERARALRRPAAQGRGRRRRTGPLHPAHRGRGDQALRQHLPRDAGGLLQRARLVRDVPRPRQPPHHRRRRSRPADRHALQQPVVRLRRLLPAEGHQAAARQLLRRPADADLRDRRGQHDAQGLHRLRHHRPRAERRRHPPADHEGRLGQLPRVLGAGDHEADQGQGRSRSSSTSPSSTTTPGSARRSPATSPASRSAPTSSSPTGWSTSSATWPTRSTPATSSARD